MVAAVAALAQSENAEPHVINSGLEHLPVILSMNQLRQAQCKNLWNLTVASALSISLPPQKLVYGGRCCFCVVLQKENGVGRNWHWHSELRNSPNYFDFNHEVRMTLSPLISLSLYLSLYLLPTTLPLLTYLQLQRDLISTQWQHQHQAARPSHTSPYYYVSSQHQMHSHQVDSPSHHKGAPTHVTRP